MDWKIEAISKLRCYEARRLSAENTAEEIKQLEMTIESIRGSVKNNSAVSGGGETQDTALLNNIVRRKELQRTRRIAAGLVSQVDSALSCLSVDERLVLERFYINPAKGNVERLCDELNAEKTKVYGLKDRAIRTFTIALYGLTEL